jgi:dTDP-glucose 4,6-dehydratase
MENILVTGGCGFIGSNFIRFVFSETGFSGRIINVDKLTYAGNPENLEGIDETFPGRYYFVKADICNRRTVGRIFENYGIDTVCHFAAESHVDRSIVSPDGFIRTNIMGTFRLLELARSFGEKISLFHHVSTDEVYGSLGVDGNFSEDSPYAPNNPYSASKAASDHLVRAYAKTYGLPVTLSNSSNNYGPYQFPEKLVPFMILNAFEGKPLPVYGDGGNIRDWIYVRDHCRAIWMIMNRGKRGEAYNIGGGCQISNLTVAQMVCDLLDNIQPLKDGCPRRDLIVFIQDRPGHDYRYAMDCTRLKEELGWVPEESFKTGIRKTIEWYLQSRRWVNRVKKGNYISWTGRQYQNIAEVLK